MTEWVLHRIQRNTISHTSIRRIRVTISVAALTVCIRVTTLWFSLYCNKGRWEWSGNEAGGLGMSLKVGVVLEWGWSLCIVSVEFNYALNRPPGRGSHSSLLDMTLSNIIPLPQPIQTRNLVWEDQSRVYPTIPVEQLQRPVLLHKFKGTGYDVKWDIALTITPVWYTGTWAGMSYYVIPLALPLGPEALRLDANICDILYTPAITIVWVPQPINQFDQFQ